MAQLDGNMYLKNIYGEGADIAGGIERGMKLGDMIKESRKQSQIQDVYKNSMKQGPDGQSTLDPNMVTKGLGELGYAKEAQEFQDQQMERQSKKMALDADKQMYEAEEIAKATYGVKDPGSYGAALNYLQSKGIDVSMVPKEYNPQFVADAQQRAITTLERMKMQIQEKDLEAKRTQQAFENKIALEGLNLKKTAATAEAAKPKLTVGQEAADREIGKDFATWPRDSAAFNKNLARLEAAEKAIEAEIAKKPIIPTSGRFIGRLPEVAQPETNIKLKQEVQGASQNMLRSTLGSQFTEKEGERIMSVAYDEKLSPAANLEKIRLAKKELLEAKQLKDQMFAEYEQKGTVSQYKRGAQQTQSRPKKIIQNGVTYELNPNTGEYE